MWYFIWFIAVLLFLASGVLSALWVESRRAPTPLTNLKSGATPAPEHV